MKTKQFVCLLAVVVLLMGAGLVRAETLFSCDFEGPAYTAGNLIGQDSWERTSLAGYLDPQVGTGSGTNNTQVFMGDTTTGQTSWSAQRPFATPLIFTSADTAIEFHLDGYGDRGSASNERSNWAATMMWEGTDTLRELYVGIYSQFAKSYLSTYYRDGNQVLRYGDSLVSGDWYEVKVVMDFSQMCSDDTTYGKLTYYYRNLTEGETEFTADGTFQDVDMYLAADGLGQFQSNGVCAFVTSYDVPQQQGIDNISIIDPVPEPSVLALLATGLVGLLCYAWRKRK